jgi:hypothetical protein
MINESKRKELDSHWEEIGKLAEKYGFILYKMIKGEENDE